MTPKEIKTEMNKTLLNVPVVFWARFKSKCAAKGLSMTEGFIEAVTAWLEKD